MVPQQVSEWREEDERKRVRDAVGLGTLVLTAQRRLPQQTSRSSAPSSER
jgi:hypothetical protein